MNENMTELVMIIDKSGSMSGLESDTIGGFNSMIAKQKKEDSDCYVSVVLFDDRSEVIYDRVDLKKIEQMNDNQYVPGGCTALLDAIGGAIHHIKNVHKYAREEDRPAKTLFIITTDGMENASRQYTYEKVKQMIERQKERNGWEFLFLGANMDAVEVAGRFGIDNRRAVTYENDSVGNRVKYDAISDAVCCCMAAPSANFGKALDESDALDMVREDYRKRHRA